jgi:methionine aminopeptidase
MHEEPSVPNYGAPGTGMRLEPGLVLAIEPMVTLGHWDVKVLSDGWTPPPRKLGGLYCFWNRSPCYWRLV